MTSNQNCSRLQPHKIMFFGFQNIIELKTDVILLSLSTFWSSHFAPHSPLIFGPTTFTLPIAIESVFPPCTKPSRNNGRDEAFQLFGFRTHLRRISPIFRLVFGLDGNSHCECRRDEYLRDPVDLRDGKPRPCCPGVQSRLHHSSHSCNGHASDSGCDPRLNTSHAPRCS